MRLLSPLVALLICTGCHVRAPVPGVRLSGDTEGRAEGQVEAEADVRVRVRAEGRYRAPPPPPPEERPEPVPLEDAPVVEFFGVPLEGTQDVVFVLDRSGSMKQPARGRIAEIRGDRGSTPPEPGVESPGDDPPADDAPGEPSGGAPYDAAGEPSGAMPDDTPDDDPARATPDDAPAEPPAQPTEPPADDPTAASPDEPPDEPAATRETPRKIDVARDELIDALTRLPGGTRLNVVFFNDWLEAYAPELTPLGESAREDLIQFVERTEPSHSTALATAMRAAFVMDAKHVVILSDGLGNKGGGPDVILRDAREAMRGGVRIDAIGIGKNQDAGLLRALADESGGLYQAL
ncbi:MAG: VWA domain-containing protein [Myxococcota bacterium]